MNTDQPYTPDQQRAADYIVEASDGNLGGGDDPVGFLIASHRVLAAERKWTKVSERQPAPHARYLIRRNDVIYTATPCYGMHAPWWVGRVLGGHESEPVKMEPADEWRKI